MKLAPEGRWIVVAAFIAAALATVFAGLSAWLAWAPFLFALQFFREPARAVNGAPNAVLAPADGRVVFVGKAPSPRGDEMLKISVFMSVFNAHVNRAPVGGEVVESRRFAGAFFNAALDKASEKNERHLLAIRAPFGEALCMQIAGLLARRVICHVGVGDSLTAGMRYGFIRFGSRVDVYLPVACRPLVALGDKVLAGVDGIAEAPTAEN